MISLLLMILETDDKQSVISGSSGVAGSVSTGVSAATRSTHHESIQSADSGYCTAKCKHNVFTTKISFKTTIKGYLSSESLLFSETEVII